MCPRILTISATAFRKTGCIVPKRMCATHGDSEMLVRDAERRREILGSRAGVLAQRGIVEQVGPVAMDEGAAVQPAPRCISPRPRAG